MQGEMKFPVELHYGDFGVADPEVERRTEQSSYNVKILMWITKDAIAEVCHNVIWIHLSIIKRERD